DRLPNGIRGHAEIRRGERGGRTTRPRDREQGGWIVGRGEGRADVVLKKRRPRRRERLVLEGQRKAVEQRARRALRIGVTQPGEVVLGELHAPAGRAAPSQR